MIDGSVFVRYLHGMPLSVRGLTTPNSDGTFSVYINADLPQETQRAACAHELYHIEHDHLYNEDPVSLNEREAQGLPCASPSRPASIPVPAPALCAKQEERELSGADRGALLEWVYEMLYGTERLQLRKAQGAFSEAAICTGEKSAPPRAL